MTATRRDFIHTMGAGLTAAGASASGLACASGDSSGSEALLSPDPDHLEPAPIGIDRLPLEWHQATTQRLKERIAELNADCIMLRTDQNSGNQPAIPSGQ